MQRSSHVFLGLLLVLSMAGCAELLLIPAGIGYYQTTTSFKYTIKDTPTRPDVRPDKALVYVIRPDVCCLFSVHFVVYDDGNPVGVTLDKTYFFFYTDPGEHLITSRAENASELRLTVAAGETYYLKQSLRFGFFSPRNDLSIMDPEEAQKEIEKCKYIETEISETPGVGP